MYMKNTVLQKQARDLLETATRDILEEYELVDKLIPKFSVGCKRVIPSGYQFLRVSSLTIRWRHI
jgi:hypothetical protein